MTRIEELEREIELLEKLVELRRQINNPPSPTSYPYVPYVPCNPWPQTPTTPWSNPIIYCSTDGPVLNQ